MEWITTSQGVVGASIAIGSCISAVHASQERVLANSTFCALAAITCRAVFLESKFTLSLDAETLCDDRSGQAATGRAETTVVDTSTVHKSRSGSASGGQGARTSYLTSALVSLAATYAFVLPMLGLMDVGSCIMFANLKVHGGNNHVFLPTGLIQRWQTTTAMTTGSDTGDESLITVAGNQMKELLSDFSGGVVRLEHTTSSFLNGLYPYVYRIDM